MQQTFNPFVTAMLRCLGDKKNVKCELNSHTEGTVQPAPKKRQRIKKIGYQLEGGFRWDKFDVEKKRAA